ncbi:unnamed protein product [Medioppia subpectinata]|uniref:Cystatin domain-containing protein n=1 Tax=Medioppia subpectinata TaxID=1979941 RepID=A0A7R9KYS4_9ACAR|nr:unnamed protein product [Medioppia subpectinata]CAG2112387.1 unnamed protein product [Medioppia subpectinata]
MSTATPLEILAKVSAVEDVVTFGRIEPFVGHLIVGIDIHYTGISVEFNGSHVSIGGHSVGERDGHELDQVLHFPQQVIEMRSIGQNDPKVGLLLMQTQVRQHIPLVPNDTTHDQMERRHLFELVLSQFVDLVHLFLDGRLVDTEGVYYSQQKYWKPLAIGNEMNTLTLLNVLFMVVMVSTTPDPLPGDVKDVDPNSSAVKNAIGFLFNAIHGSIDTTQAIGMGKVLKTQSQVVSGLKYYITLEINETNCAQNVTDLTNCKVIKTEVCNSIILSQLWDQNLKNQVLFLNCNGFSYVSMIVFVLTYKTMAVILGGKQVVRSNDPDLQPIIDFTESMLNNGVNSIYTHKIAHILKAERQVVSGDKYYLTFEFKRTNCRKGQPVPEDCVFTKTEICSAEVWSQPWLSDGKLQLISFHCEKPEKRDSF